MDISPMDRPRPSVAMTSLLSGAGLFSDIQFTAFNETDEISFVPFIEQHFTGVQVNKIHPCGHVNQFISFQILKQRQIDDKINQILLFMSDPLLSNGFGCIFLFLSRFWVFPDIA